MFKKTSCLGNIFEANKEDCASKDFTPTYLLVAQDLNSREDQVFEAAVYYLCVIARQKQEYRKEIIALLKEEMKKNKAQSARTAYIKNMLKINEL